MRVSIKANQLSVDEAGSYRSHSGNEVLESTTAEPFDIKRWEKLNPWLIEGQADDRMPMVGAAGDGNGSSSVRRSTARRTHQMMYKKWSQARHD